MTIWKEKRPIIKPSENDSLTEKLLKIRGINEDEIIDFLSPSEEFLIPANLMRNIEVASERISAELDRGGKIIVAGDPDADGVTSLALLVLRLRELHENEDLIQYIYPQRDMGHGIHGQIVCGNDYNEKEQELVAENIEKLKDADLLIIVDSSSNDIDGVRKLKDFNEKLSLKENVIIVDHHEFNDKETQDSIDELCIIVNPQHESCNYPNKTLSGVGVAYKLCTQIDELFGMGGYSDKYLDLVAVGMVGDMMSMKNLENRYLVSMGLTDVQNIGLTRILKSGKVDMYKYNTIDIGFSVAPLINASARMGSLELAIELLLVKSDNEAKPIRLKMNKLNKERQKLQSEIASKYEDNIDLSQKIILISDNESNKGFNGLVAQSLAKKYQRPVFVVRNSGGICSGSGRSYGGFDTQSFLSELDWVEASGHKQSHGLVYPADKEDELIAYIEENMTNDVSKEEVIYYDMELNLDNVWEDFAEIERLNRIVGTDFPEIKVKISSMVLDRVAVGKTKKETVKFEVDNDVVFIKFKVHEDWLDHVGVFDKIEVIGTPSINEFYHFGLKEVIRTPQVIIRDVGVD